MFRHIAAFLFVFFVAAASVRAADEAADKSKSEKEAVAKTVASLEDAFNAGDAKALAACWTADGQFIGPRGERIDGREKIEAAFTDFLARHKNAKLRLDVVSCRLVADDVALVDLTGEMTPPPEGLDAEPSSSLVLVKQEGRWLIGSMHESLRAVPSPRLRLQCLSWMVGDWVEADADPSGPTMHSTCTWTANGSYLIRKFTAETKRGVSFGGTEVIGWDPRTHRIRSWTFDSDGGFGESVWTRAGDLWEIEYAGVLANGDDVAATHVVTIEDADEIEVQSIDRTINGEKQPDLPPVKFERKATAEQPKAKSDEPATLPQQVLPQ